MTRAAVISIGTGKTLLELIAIDAVGAIQWKKLSWPQMCPHTFLA